MANNTILPLKKLLAFSLSAICAISLIPSPALAVEEDTNLSVPEVSTNPEDTSDSTEKDTINETGSVSVPSDQTPSYDHLANLQQDSFYDPKIVQLGTTQYGTATDNANYYGIKLSKAGSYNLSIYINQDAPVPVKLDYKIWSPSHEYIRGGSENTYSHYIPSSFRISTPGVYRITISSPGSSVGYHFSVTEAESTSTTPDTTPKGFTTIDGDLFYFDPNTGHLVTGWQTIDGKRYYFSTITGATAKGLVTISGSTYYFGSSSHVMATGWQTIGGKRYYFSTKNGKSASGLVSIGGYRYYFGAKSHAAATGWQKLNGSWYYFSSKTNRAAKGLAVIDGKRYYFNPSSNRMATGWQKIGGYWYYFSKNTGAAAKGSVTIDGKRYYFDPATNRMR
ncbi:N-acetylmuramoyl-L-alanine amidase family protein [Eggerthellaceae bacterium 3-80]|nr:N-acetylmuramoyl-L-alanine amidase family protein [bacterium D16-34]